MINENRIVPITVMDLLSMYGLIIKARGTSVTKIDPDDVEGNFSAASAATVFCSEPVKSLTFGSSVSSATVYFVPAYNYEGFKKTGATITESGTVDPDGRTLYVATLSSSAVTFTKAGF